MFDPAKYHSAGECNAAKRILSAILADGHAVSICDGLFWSTSITGGAAEVEKLYSHLGTTGMDTIRVRDSAGEKLGDLYLIWGNASDGSELVADHTDNELMAKYCKLTDV